MRVAVIGGTGLIGTELLAQLAARGHEASVLARRAPAAAQARAAWRAADIADRAALCAALAPLRCDAVVHLAALLQFECDRDPQAAVRVNVDGTLNVLEACRTLGVRRLVFGSSIAAYGERHDRMREDDPPANGTGLYGLTKRLGERLGERYAALHGLQFVALRYGGVFGPQAVGGAGMAQVRERIKATARGADVTVEGASGEERSHLTHARDAAGATCAALEHPAPRHSVYNVAGPEANYLDLRGFHAAVRRLVPGAGAVIWSGRGRTMGPVDTTRLREDLGFVPAVTVEAGLAADLATPEAR